MGKVKYITQFAPCITWFTAYVTWYTQFVPRARLIRTWLCWPGDRCIIYVWSVMRGKRFEPPFTCSYIPSSTHLAMVDMLWLSCSVAFASKMKHSTLLETTIMCWSFARPVEISTAYFKFEAVRSVLTVMLECMLLSLDVANDSNLQFCDHLSGAAIIFILTCSVWEFFLFFYFFLFTFAFTHFTFLHTHTHTHTLTNPYTHTFHTHHTNQLPAHTFTHVILTLAHQLPHTIT